MNIYVVTEGKVETLVYREWIPRINPNLSPVQHIDQVQQGNVYLVSAKGYPLYFDVISKAVEDINHLRIFDRLVICADSEELTRNEKLEELHKFMDGHYCTVETRIVIQHFCFETWALANRKIVRDNPSSPKLREYKRFYNVRTSDPEYLPSKPDEGLNRAQLATRYLRAALNDKYRNLTYTKSNPGPILHHKYLAQVKLRYEETGHIDSFGDFLQAFL